MAKFTNTLSFYTNQKTTITGILISKQQIRKKPSQNIALIKGTLLREEMIFADKNK